LKQLAGQDDQISHPPNPSLIYINADLGRYGFCNIIEPGCHAAAETARPTFPLSRHLTGGDVKI
jgi:hypothetical protein